jgi:hypothetical protein
MKSEVLFPFIIQHVYKRICGVFVVLLIPQRALLYRVRPAVVIPLPLLRVATKWNLEIFMRFAWN